VQFLSLLFKNSSVFSLMSMLSLSPEILSSTCSCLLEWLSTLFFIWLKEVFVPGFLFDYFFLRPSISLLNSSNISCSFFFISFISFFHGLLSFISEFVEILSEFN
jgi:hypothetical protein